MFSRFLLASLIGTATVANADANPANGVYNVVIEKFSTSDCSGAPVSYDFKELGQCTGPEDGKYKKAEWAAATLTWTETKYTDSACTTAASGTPETKVMNCTQDGSEYLKGTRSDDANSGTLYIENYPNSSCSGTPENRIFHGGDKCTNSGSTSRMYVIYGKGGDMDFNMYSAANCTTASLNTTASYSIVGGFVCTAYPTNADSYGKYYKFSAWHPNEPAGAGVASGSVVMSPAVPPMGLLGFAVSLGLWVQ